eukprot:XP_011669663.1 PREDICTED: uncharacterized protein LOC100889325 [Strongylocentrotus purpuratus]
MGVQNLWQILAPVKSEESIESLKGKKIAVDLAIWLVESQVTGMKMMQGRVSKPHLRNLFFRASNFLRLGVKLVFVIDGTPPELKWEEIARRNEVRLGGGGGGARCQELLELMGVPCIQSKGEAEAMCAALNSAGIVDGCMTEDGDAFLYGARIVYRNLNMATGKVDCYRMDDIETKLDLDRGRLVALAILLGCDYLPKGVPGVGKEVAMRFMKSLPSSVDPLNLFQDWRGGCASACLTNEERDVRKKSVRVEGFPNQDVIQEFLRNKERPPTHHSEWRRPLLLHLQQFNLVKMEWPIEYTQEKVVPLMTLYDLTHMTSDPKGRLTPASVVKLRVRQGVPCAEVKWHKPEEDKENDEDCEPFYTTVEERELFTSAYPDVMEQFMVAMEMKKAKGRGKKKKETSSSMQQEGSTVDDHRVVMDIASKHPCEDFHEPFTLDQENPLKVDHTPSQAESCHGNKIGSRELESSHGTDGDRAGRSRAPSQGVTRHGDADEEDMRKKLINLSLHDGRLEMSLKGGGGGGIERGGGGARVELRRGEGGRCSGKTADGVQEDETRLKRIPIRDKKAKPGKKCLSGKDLNSGKECSRGITHEGMSSLKSKSLSVGLGTKERTLTKDNVLVTKVTVDIDTEGKEKEREGEEEGESFIEVLPLSQRLGCHSLRGFIPNSRRIGNQNSSCATSNAAKRIDHLSDDESDPEMQSTIPQLCHEESQDTSQGDIRSLEFTLADNAKVVGRKTHSRETVAGSERPTLPTAGECCKGSSPENIMDQGKSMATEASEINAKRYISHPKDRLKSTPDLKRNQDIKVSKMHTPCHKSTSPATCEVIDLTEDSPLKDQPMSAHSAVHSAEEVEETDHQSPTARALGVQSRSLSEKEGDNNSTYSDEDIPYFQEKPVHERLLQISVSNGNSTYNAKKNESSFMKLDNSLAKFMNELSLVSNSSSLVASFEEIDDSVFIVEDEEPCLDDDKQERTHLEENNEEKRMEFVDVCQGTVRNVSGKVQESYSLSEISLGVPEGIGVVPDNEVDTEVTESELPGQGEVDESTGLRSRETKNDHVVSDSKTCGNLDSLAVTEQACSGKSEDGERLMKETKNNSGDILGQIISGSLDSSEAAVQETCEPQQDKGVVAHPSISCDVMGNMSRSVHVETKRIKSRKGRIGKTKKMHKLHDSVLIENGLMKILQMMSPVTCLSRSGRRRETSQLSEVAQASEDPCSQTSCLAFQNGRPCPELAILSPSSLSSSATASSSFTTSGSTSIVTPNLPGPDVTTTSEQTSLSIPEEPLAILANSATGAHTVSPCTKSSHLLRGQLLSMLSQLTPGDSPLMGAKVLQKPPKFRPPCVGRHGFSSKAKQRIHSESVQDGPKCTPYSDILRESTQTITDQIIGVCESTSVKSNTSLEGTNSPPKVCIGDSSSSIQESRSVRTRAVSTTVDEPRPKPKPRSLSQPSRTVLSVNAKRNRSKHKSCSQPVGSRNRSRSKTSLKGFQRRESMVAMECNLAKILEGLSLV